MGVLYLKNPLLAISLTVLFNLLGLLFQPLFILAAAGVALHFLLGNYRLGFTLLGASVLTLWSALEFIVSQGEGEAIQYEAYWVLLCFYLPLILSSLMLSRTANQAYAVSLNACFAMVITSVLSVFGLPYLEAVKAFLRSIAGQNVTINPADIENIVALLIPAIGMTVFLLLTASLFVARLWQSRAFNPGGFGEEFRHFQIGRTIALVAALLASLGFANVDFIRDWQLIIVLLLGLQGLALIHFFAKKQQISRKMLGVFYLFLCLILPLAFASLWAILLMLLALLAVADGYLDFRRRYTLEKGL